MAIDIIVPRLGWNMDEGVFVAWLKADGEIVKAGEPLFSLETDKAVQEVESLDTGTLHILPTGPQPGDTVAVGTVIGRLAQRGENGADEVMSAAPRSTSGRNRPGHSPRTREGRPVELGLDLRPRSRRSGARRARLASVIVIATPRSSCGPREATHRGFRTFTEAEFQAIPVSATRRAIAERMLASVHATAPVTLMSTIDATNLVNLRQQFKAVAEKQQRSCRFELGQLQRHCDQAHGAGSPATSALEFALGWRPDRHAQEHPHRPGG